VQKEKEILVALNPKRTLREWDVYLKLQKQHKFWHDNIAYKKISILQKKFTLIWI